MTRVRVERVPINVLVKERNVNRSAYLLPANACHALPDTVREMKSADWFVTI